MRDWKKNMEILCDPLCRQVQIACHRGKFSSSVMENTALAFQAAVGQGADMVEMDLARTKDGRIVGHHDDTMIRLFHNPGRIGDYTLEELKNMENSLIKAQKEIREIKYKTASLEVKALQAEIDSLNTSFTIDRLGELQAFAERLNKLKLAERNILDLTRYNALMASYNAYLETLKPAINSVNGVLNSTYNYTGAAAITVLSLISVITVAGVCLVKKFY